MYIYIHMYTYISCMYIHIRIHSRVHIYIYIYTSIYMYMHILPDPCHQHRLENARAAEAKLCVDITKSKILAKSRSSKSFPEISLSPKCTYSSHQISANIGLDKFSEQIPDFENLQLKRTDITPFCGLQERRWKERG